MSAMVMRPAPIEAFSRSSINAPLSAAAKTVPRSTETTSVTATINRCVNMRTLLAGCVSSEFQLKEGEDEVSALLDGLQDVQQMTL